MTKQILSVERVIDQKLGKRAHLVPKWLVSWLKKTIHQDEMNRYLTRVDGMTGIPWLKETVKYLDFHVTVEGEENLPPADKGPYTFVCNHPLGGPDGIAIGAELGSRYDGRLKYIVNDILMFIPGLKPLCIPVNVTGSQSRSMPRLIEQGFASDDNILMFPAGLCSRKIHGEIHDLPWRKTFITKSVQYKRDVVPMHFSGRNSDSFYRLASFCKAIHSPVNIAMLFLPDECYRNAHGHFTLKIGKPIPWQTFDKTHTPAEWARYVESICYSL